MDGLMQRHSVNLCAFVLAVASCWTLLGAAQPFITRGSSPDTQQYCNEKYMYCTEFPSLGKARPHEGDSPNHGVSIDLAEPGDEAWTYAHWDAAMLGNIQKMALHRLEILLDEHNDARVSMAPAFLAGLPAYRIRLSYSGVPPTTEELIIAYRKPRGDSQETGIVYEVGLKCKESNFSANVGALESLVGTFRLVGK